MVEYTHSDSIFADRVYHRDKKEMILDKAKRRKLEVILTTHETARVHMVSILKVTVLK